MTPSPEVSRESATRRRSSTIVVYEILGFVAIIALSWINELLGLPSLIFGTDHLGGWHESLLEDVSRNLLARGRLIRHPRQVG